MGRLLSIINQEVSCRLRGKRQKVTGVPELYRETTIDKYNEKALADHRLQKKLEKDLKYYQNGALNEKKS